MAKGLRPGLKNLVIFLGLVLWPLNLFLHNTPADFLKYLLPTTLLLASFLLYARKTGHYLIPVLFIPLIEPKLTLLPLLVVIADFWLGNAHSRKALLVVAVLLLLFNWKAFFGQTIFVPDREARQVVIGKTYLYPNPLLARTFQNKLRIPLDKFSERFFALTDPNNYFFGFHPRQIVVENQNLTKYPFIGLLFVLFGLYHLGKSENKKFISPETNSFIIIISVASLITLTTLTVFDRNDFILWVPLTLLFLHGISQFEKRHPKKAWLAHVVFILFAIPELARIFPNP